MAMTERFNSALVYASKKHRLQRRKGTKIPYVAHLLGVASIVLEDGGTETEAIAAILHDAPEDQGGLATLRDIRRRFGPKVAKIVEGCTDTFEKPKPDWKLRKVAYLKHIESSPKSVLLVSAADKLHNARAILSDYRKEDDHVWLRFAPRSRSDILWYYNALAVAFRKNPKSAQRIGEELVRTIREIESLIRARSRKSPEYLLRRMSERC